MTDHDAFEATEIVDASGKAYKFVGAVLTDHGDIGQADEILATAQRIAAAGLEETRQAVHALRVDTLSLDKSTPCRSTRSSRGRARLMRRTR